MLIFQIPDTAYARHAQQVDQWFLDNQIAILDLPGNIRNDDIYIVADESKISDIRALFVDAKAIAPLTPATSLPEGAWYAEEQLIEAARGQGIQPPKYRIIAIDPSWEWALTPTKPSRTYPYPDGRNWRFPSIAEQSIKDGVMLPLDHMDLYDLPSLFPDIARSSTVSYMPYVAEHERIRALQKSLLAHEEKRQRPIIFTADIEDGEDARSLSHAQKMANARLENNTELPASRPMPGKFLSRLAIKSAPGLRS